MSASRNPIPEQHVPFDLSAYLCAPHLLRNAETGERPIGSSLLTPTILVALWPDRCAADTYFLPAGHRGLRLAVVNQTEDSNAI